MRTTRQLKVPYIFTFIFAFTVCTGIIISFAGLIPLGNWGDEFYQFTMLRDGGIPYFIDRITTWSPRPLSELFIFAYEHAVQITHRPLITSVLSLVWSLSFICIVITPVLFFRNFRLQERGNVLILALALMSSFLLGHPVSEVFYWPMGALPYFFTISAVCLLLWSVCAGGIKTKAGQVTCSFALVVAATCSEVGAIFSCTFITIVIFANIILKFKEYPDDDKVHRTRILQLWLIVPLSCSVCVLYMLAAHRGVDAGEMPGIGDLSLRHHLVNSFLAAFPAFVRQLLSSDTGITTGLLTKTLFFSGAYLILSSIIRGTGKRTDGYYLIGIAITCFITCFTTIFTEFYHFGIVFEQRQYTVRECLIFLALVAISGALAILQAGIKGADGHKTIVALVCLIIATVIPAYKDLPKLEADYSHFRTIKKIQTENWISGISHGKSMVYIDRPPGEIVHGESGLSGTYDISSPNIPGDAATKMMFFNKKEITFIPNKDK